jgi:aminopeptidase N
MYVEQIFGKADGLKYVNGYKSHVTNRTPIITTRGIHKEPPQDMYFKGALFLNTLRSVVDDDAKWWAIVRGVYDKFKYHNIMTEDMVAFFNEKMHRNMTPVFDQYLRQTALPVLELKFDPEASTVQYRWKTDEAAFAMPVKVGTMDKWETVEATTAWKTMRTTLTKDTFEVATDLFYITVEKN